MSRLIGGTVAVALAAPGGPALATSTVHVDADSACRIVRILPSGRRLVERQTEVLRPPASARAASATSSASASGVSVSSRASGGGYASASASTTTGRRGRTVTTTHDENGCTVVIDDRAGRGARR